MKIQEFMHWNRPANVPVGHRSRLGRSFSSLQEDMNHLFQNFFNDNNYSAWSEEFGTSFPAVDVIENDKNFNVKAEVAGYDSDDIDVSVTDGFLTLKGERREEEEEKDKNYLRRETSYGSFQRTIALPETANCDKAEASFKNGILSIDVPKKAGAVQKPKKLQIKKAA